MRLYLTDSHGRPIPENVQRQYPDFVPLVPANSAGDPNPTPVNQSTLGNRSFECVIKVDIVQYMGGQNNVLQSAPVAYTVPARFGTEPLNKLNYGESGYPDPNFNRMRIN